jgi:hypothetical protein
MGLLYYGLILEALSFYGKIFLALFKKKKKKKKKKKLGLKLKKKNIKGRHGFVIECERVCFFVCLLFFI